MEPDIVVGYLMKYKIVLDRALRLGSSWDPINHVLFITMSLFVAINIKKGMLFSLPHTFYELKSHLSFLETFVAGDSNDKNES